MAVATLLHQDDLVMRATSETAEAPSVLFSEQARMDLDQRHQHHLTEEEQTLDTDNHGPDHDDATMHPDRFYYVDEDAPPERVGIVAGGVELDNDRGLGDAAGAVAIATQHEGEDSAQPEVDMNFWLESVEGADSQAPCEQPEREAGPSRSPRKARTTDDNAVQLQTSRPAKRSQYIFERDDEEGESDSYDDIRSYHSGDSDEYEMDHRPWLERTAIKKDIQALYNISGTFNPTLEVYRYKIVDRLGEGTFSSVYLAHDTLHNLHDNTYWASPPKDNHVDVYEPTNVKVALKKILVTSSPARVENELSILENLRGCRNVSPLVSAFRDEDQIVIVLPFHPSDDFRYFYRLMNPAKMRQYMTCLLRALKDIHARGIIHRDVKPANFLFDYESGHGVLVDFGLAERYTPPRRAVCQHEPATRATLHGRRTKTNDTGSVEQAVYDARKRSKLGEGKIGFRQEDGRPAVKTNRAGTRGFRAPEVLLKCPDQTVAIDVWSAGIILLSLLSHKFPVFNSQDDIEALMEIAAVFGRAPMERCAMLHNRTIITNVPTVDSPPDSLAHLILRLNPNLYTPHQPQPTQEQAAEHITAVDQALDLCGRLLRLDSTTRITASAALRHAFLTNDEDSGPDELLHPTEGKCGNLHSVAEDGTHQARFGNVIEDMRFGQGLPTSRHRLCPEHEHWQQRSGVNPLGAAYGATLDDEYYHRAGFHVHEEHLGWDDMGPRPSLSA